MNRKEYEEIIDFAIGREKEAVAFYRELQEIVHFGAQKEALKEFELMETGHIKLLESVRSKGPKEADPVAGFGFDAEEFLVPHEPAAGMSFQDILIHAIKREERSLTLYRHLRDKASDPELVKTFSFLESEEARHRGFFEELYEKDIQSDN